MSKDSNPPETAPRKFKLGPLANLNQVTKGLAKTIRAINWILNVIVPWPVK